MATLRFWWHLAACAVVLAIALLAAAAPAQAASLVVNTTDDELNSDGDCSLREAIQAANTNSGIDSCAAGEAGPTVDVITFAVNGTITLGSRLPAVSEDLTIDGPGAASMIISGNNAYGVLEVAGGATLNVQDVTVADGFRGSEDAPACAFPGDGGGIANCGILNVSNSVFSRNAASDGGGAILTGRFTTLTVTNTSFAENTSGGGGAILSFGASSITVANSSFSRNSAGFAGGAILASDSLTVTNSTFSGNSAGSFGGGVRSGIGFFTPLTITNSTFSGNSADSGGGIYQPGGVAVVTNSTLSDNSADLGGAIYKGSGRLTLQNTIVANSPSGGNCFVDSSLGAPITDGGGNLQHPGTDCGSTVTSADPLLDPLSANDGPASDPPDGPTKTHALAAASPAIDSAIDANCPSADQRGVSRPQGAHCDIGAFERVLTVPVAIDIMPGSATNTIKLSKRGVIPVAMLGTSTFDPSTVDPSTVCFGDIPDDPGDCTVAPGTVLQDVNKDKIKDLVLHFEINRTGIDSGDTQACLIGELFDGTAIEGCDSINTK